MTLTFQIFRNKNYLTDRKLKMSACFIFEIKRAKADRIFSFLKGSFSVMSDPMDMIFGVFSKSNVRLLKYITPRFFSKYSKSYNILNVKSCFKLNSPSEKMGRLEFINLHVSNRTLQKLFRMVLIKSVAFVIFEILRNLVSMQNFLNANNCWRKQNFENFPTWPYLYFWCTFRIIIWFCLIFGFLGCRKCC